jgi:OHCU decarboxylase
MRSNPAEYQLSVPQDLEAAVALLAQTPGAWLPIAGGTDVMVQFAAGSLKTKKLLSIWNLPELRRIQVFANEIHIGAGSTYTDLRNHAVVSNEFPLLTQAASWTGGLANQNRGTIGGNIVNASPAADSLPALLVYQAELILISVRGERRVPYLSFHTAYKKMQLAPDELIRAVCIPRLGSSYFSYARKVGGRKAQAISKVCMAALGKLKNSTVEDVRIALGSVAPVPLRLTATEAAIRDKHLAIETIALARKTAMAETSTIDDIRSTARYRAAVVGNLVAEFLEDLAANDGVSNATLALWNRLPAPKAEGEIAACCGSKEWSRRIVDRRPFADPAALLDAADEIWNRLTSADWLEAFSAHPRIGESRAPRPVSTLSTAWSAQEQDNVSKEDDQVKAALAEANRKYELRFGRTFIVCATGKTAAEILHICRRRLRNDEATELHEAADQQRQITRLRLQKWMSQ